MTRLGDKISVPELDEQRLARIESRVVAAAMTSDLRPRRSLPRLHIGIAAVALAGIAVVVALELFTAPVPAPSRALVPTLSPPVVVTGPGERATVELGDAVVSIGESSRIGVHRDVGGGVVLDLEAGEIACEVDERAGRAPFQVRAGEVTVSVVGTGFRVVRRDGVRVEVEHGVVEVSTPRGTERLERGDRWEGSDGGGTRIASAGDDSPSGGNDTPPSRQGEANAPPSRQGEANAPPSRQGEANADAPDRRGSTTDDERQRSAEPDHRAGAAPNERDPRRPATHEDRRSGQSDRRRRPAPGERARDAAGDPTRTPPRRSSHPAARDAEVAELLRIEVSDPARAAVDFLTLAARRSGDVASFALYSRAYLQLTRLDDARAAVETARQYDRRFPSGAEADPMHWIRILALQEIGDDTSCRAAAYSYLRRHPSGQFASAALAITRR